MTGAGPDLVRAAGGVVWRDGDGGDGVLVLVVHRPKYDDWSLPKGKLDPGETDEQAALREVHEETGFVCDLGEPLGETRYDDRYGRPKVVRYWAMQVRDGSFEPNREVDEIRWVPVADVPTLVTYSRDAAVVERLRVP